MPANVIRSITVLTLPGGIDRAAARGQREQNALLHTMIGDGQATVGESAHVGSVA